MWRAFGTPLTTARSLAQAGLLAGLRIPVSNCPEPRSATTNRRSVTSTLWRSSKTMPMHRVVAVSVPADLPGPPTWLPRPYVQGSAHTALRGHKNVRSFHDSACRHILLGEGAQLRFRCNRASGLPRPLISKRKHSSQTSLDFRRPRGVGTDAVSSDLGSSDGRLPSLFGASR